ncbi:MAG: hypothetical protein OHK0039_06260 [Bacteroidia bacterium]
MAENKTQPTSDSVEAFLSSVEPAAKQADCRTLLALFQEITGEPAVMWGNMVGFGKYHYRYDSGREGDMFITGFAARKQALTIYAMPGFDRYEALMSDLGKYKTGVSCLYIKRLSDVDMAVLRELVTQGFAYMRSKYG